MLQYVRSFILRWFGVKVDYHKAAWLYEKACDGEYANGCHNLGVLYMNGQGVKRDYIEAAKFYEKACEADVSESCSNLGVLYENGQGVQ